MSSTARACDNSGSATGRSTDSWTTEISGGFIAPSTPTGRSPLADDAHLKAALLAIGGGAWLAARTAAAMWGLRTLNLAPIEVGVVASSTPRHRGLKVIRACKAPHRSEIRSRRGFKVSSVPRLLAEIAPRVDPEELDRLIETAACGSCGSPANAGTKTAPAFTVT